MRYGEAGVKLDAVHALESPAQEVGDDRVKLFGAAGQDELLPLQSPTSWTRRHSLRTMETPQGMTREIDGA